MKTFEWTHLFETGLPEVDQQHQRLVQLVNQLAQDVDSATEAHIDQALQALADYTVYHFQCEERIMFDAGVADAHALHHQETHQRFIAQVGEWLQRRKQGEAISLRQLLDFLANWLIFHILGDDQSLGRQVLAIRRGENPLRAHSQDRASDDPRTEILLGALRRLYGGLVARNDELLAAKRSLSELNAGLEQRVAERTAELQEANQRLQEEQQRVLDAEKMASLGRMVAGFAHEVNTPIGIAIGVISQTREVVADFKTLLGQDEVSEEEIESRLHILEETTSLGLSSLGRAAELVKSFKRTAVDQASENDRDYNLRELLEDVVRSLQNAFRNLPISIEIDCPPDLELYGPPGAVVQLLSNLLLNSKMHGFADGRQAGAITIAASMSGDKVIIDYRDDGQGMSEQTLKQAFEPFYTTRRGTGGSGLGLYIAYNLATRALHGNIQCDSAPGQGTHFSIRYPMDIRALKENGQ